MRTYKCRRSVVVASLAARVVRSNIVHMHILHPKVVYSVLKVAFKTNPLTL